MLQFQGLFGKTKTKPKKKGKFDELRQDKIDDRFKWLDMVYLLMKELNTTDKEIYKKNYISCLNWMSYFYQKNKIQESKKGNI